MASGEAVAAGGNAEDSALAASAFSDSDLAASSLRSIAVGIGIGLPLAYPLTARIDRPKLSAACCWVRLRLASAPRNSADSIGSADGVTGLRAGASIVAGTTDTPSSSTKSHSISSPPESLQELRAPESYGCKR
jgi:hypothetical protein